MGHPLESIRAYTLPNVFNFMEMKVESMKKQTKQTDAAAGKRRFTHAEILAKIAKQRAKK